MNKSAMFVDDKFSLFNTDVYFWYKTERSYMGHGWTNPTLTQKGSNDNIFRIIPQAQNAFDRSVAIQRVGKGDYLSCRRKAIATGYKSALAEWRSEIGEFETFQMIMPPPDKRDNSVIFKSHNDLYLAINGRFHTCAFKTCKGRDEFDLPLKGRWEILDRSWPGAGDRDGELNTARSIVGSSGAIFSTVGKVTNVVELVGNIIGET